VTTELRVVRGDIGLLDVDAVVNAAKMAQFTTLPDRISWKRAVPWEAAIQQRHESLQALICRRVGSFARLARCGREETAENHSIEYIALLSKRHLTQVVANECRRPAIYNNFCRGPRGGAIDSSNRAAEKVSHGRHVDENCPC